ncbi:T9SS type A sorting domain-containing protein [Aquimarina agarivorans]|uniref:T9SS type A sorting domain-containing protein n=1 Tax=Aquimarina agarivorans TaxID=980584 RepID=UPI000248ED9D|nr:T9SS type A sorting domain-containing protein [Aquimarina agarivorans]
MHADQSDGDYNRELGKLDSLLVRYRANYGRGTGLMRFISSQVTEDPTRPGFADPTSIEFFGNRSTVNYANFQTGKHATQTRGGVITAAQDRPFFPDGTLTDSGNFAFSTADGPADDDFGTATGEFMGRFLRAAYGNDPNSGMDGPPRPIWVEAINEPFFPLFDFANDNPATAEEIFEFHRSVAREVKRFNPDAKVGGFTNAFPDLQFFGAKGNDQRIFGQWDQRWEGFINTSGDQMDFYSVHLYDFPSIGGGLELLRKGGNNEAILDMIEHYNTIRWGEVKPWVISEYGTQLNDFFSQNWTPGRDWFILRAFSSMMMQFMERPDVIEKTVPFVLGRAEFLYAGAANPGFVYPWRMMRRAEEFPLPSGIGINQANAFPQFPNNQPPDDQKYDFTEVVKFYELWANVDGTRVDTKSSDLDIMVDAYVDASNNKAYVILNSLEDENTSINLNQIGIDAANVSEVEIQHLFLGSNGNLSLTKVQSGTAPETVVVNEDATMIIEYTFATAPSVSNTSEERKIYALSANPNLPAADQGTVFPRTIQANQPITFIIPGVTKGSFGEATLRIGIGRTINTPIIPVVTVNGTEIEVPVDFRGDDQSDRAQRAAGQRIFFGLLEADVPYDLLIAGDNTVEVTFPTEGGAISSCALQTFEFTREVTRTNSNDRTRFLSFNNQASFILSGDDTPTLEVGSDFEFNISYATGLLNAEEEELLNISTDILRLTPAGAVVGRTAFDFAVPQGSENADSEVIYTFTVPEFFAQDNLQDLDTTNPLPTTPAELGNDRLVLRIVMSINNDTIFETVQTDVNIVNNGTLSTESFTNGITDTVTVYPNPTTSKLTISEEVNSWKIYDLSGKIIYKGEASTIKVDQLAEGLYYIILDDNKTQVFKFVKN